MNRAISRSFKRLKNAFESENIPFDGRFFSFPLVGHDEFLGLLGAADIYLDLPTFSGYTTAWKGAHCGIPIVTCEGTYMRQRLASGLLRKIGLSENIAHSSAEYVEKVCRLVQLRRNTSLWLKYRDKIKSCASSADGDLSVIGALEEFLSEAVRASIGKMN